MIVYDKLQPNEQADKHARLVDEMHFLRPNENLGKLSSATTNLQYQSKASLPQIKQFRFFQFLPCPILSVCMASCSTVDGCYSSVAARVVSSSSGFIKL